MDLIFSPFRHPALNLALEEVFFHQPGQDKVLLYINEASVILGSNQLWQVEVDEFYCSQQGIGLYRRLSGGGAVYHDSGNLNYSFIRERVAGQSAINADFLKPVVIALHEMGVEAVIGQRKDLWLKDGHKISGTASHLKGNRVLQHGTLLYDANLQHLQQALSSKITASAGKGIPSVPSPVKNIFQYLIDGGMDTLTMDQFCKHITESICRHLNLNKIMLTAEEAMQLINPEIIEKYLSEAWTRKK